jgi:hypothetical protein
MLKWLIRKRLAAFERTYDYDTSYIREILAVDTRAVLALARLGGMSNYRRDVPRDVYYAARLTGTMAEDCGPCTQLNVAMALRDRVDPRTIAAVLRGDETAMTDDVRLGVQFARAALRREDDAAPLREVIVRRWGPRALVSLAFGVTAARLYPTLKYALGHGTACRRVVVAGEPVDIVRDAA